MEFVDTHCHLDDDAFEKDLPHVLETARAAGVRRFVNIGYEPESWVRSLALAETHPDVSFALGMHPNSADRWANETAAELERLLRATEAVAIGETGLDYYRDYVDRSQQRAAFRDQLELARQFGLPVIIHMRGDVEHEIVSTLEDFRDVRVLFHSFDGSARLRDIVLERGDVFGIGGLMTRASSVGLRETLKSVPLSSFVLETDAPYLVPKGVKDRRNTSASIPIIGAALAEILEVSVKEVAQRTTRNADALFAARPAILSGAAG